MAENTTSSSGASSPPSSPPSPKGKQYIRASANDDVLEPDALRGSDQVKKDANVQDDEEDRRKAISPEEKK